MIQNLCLIKIFAILAGQKIEEKIACTSTKCAWQFIDERGVPVCPMIMDRISYGDMFNFWLSPFAWEPIIMYCFEGVSSKPL